MTIQNLKAKISNITVTLINSRGGEVGIDELSLNEVFTYANLNKAYLEEFSATLPTTALFTGKCRVALKSEYRKNARIMVRQTMPLPLTIGSIVAELSVSEGVSNA